MKKPNWNIKFSGIGMPAKSISHTILKNRGVEDIKEFLHPSSDNIYPGQYLIGIEQAVKLIDSCNQPLVYADTDTDGCCAGAIMCRWLKEFVNNKPDFRFCEFKPMYFINENKDHGIQNYFYIPESSNIDLLIVVDSINDDPRDYLRFLDRGIKIIVLDHHKISDAYVHFNHPNFVLVSSANNYPNPHLSGAGVVWKFCRYLDYVCNTHYADDLVDLATCGIIADVCSVGPDSMENRAICHKGFINPQNPGILALCGKEPFSCTQISYNIAPLINAANRMNFNDFAFQLLVTDDKDELKHLINELEIMKEDQKNLVEQYLPQLIKQAEDQKDNKCIKIIINDIDNLAGLLATKLCDQYKRPVLVLHDCEDSYRGSMRSYGTDDFAAIINESGFGECKGHENSAGIDIPKCYWESFCLYIENELADYKFTQDYDVDVEIDKSQVSIFLLLELENINRITGANFKPVKVCIDNITDFEVKGMSGGKHLSVSTSDFKYIQWNFNDWDKIKTMTTMSAIGTLNENIFRGKRNIQVMMEDCYFANKPKATYSRIFHPNRICEF